MPAIKLKNIIFWLAIGALLTPFLINVQTYFPFIITKATVFRVIVELMLVIWVFWLIKDKKTFPKLTPLAKAVVIYGLIIFISALLGVNFQWSFFSGNERMEGVFGIWHFILFFVILATTFDWRGIERILKIQVGVSLLYAFVALLAYSGVGRITSQMTSNRLAGYTGNPSYYAAYALFNAFLALYFYFQQYHLDRKLFNYWLLIFVGESFLMFLTGCRGTMIGFALAFLCLGLAIIFKAKEKDIILKRLFIIGFIVLFSSLATLYVFKNTNFVKHFFALERLTSFSLKDPTTVSRLMSAKTAFHAFLEKPFFGWGPENYQSAYIKYFNPLVIKYLPGDFFFDRAHNKPMEVLATTGIFGFFSYLAIFISAFWILYKKQQKESDWFLPSLAIGGALIGYFVQNIFIFDFHESYLMFYLVLAFIASLIGYKNNDVIEKVKERKQENSDFSQQMFKYFVVIAVSCLVLYSLSFWVIKPYLVSQKIITVMKLMVQQKGEEAYDLGRKIFFSPSFFKKDAVIGLGKIYDQYNSKLDNENRQKIAELLIQQSDQILNEHPDEYLILYGKADLEALPSSWNANALKEAEETIKKAIEIAPAFPQPRIFYTKLLLTENNYEEASNQINQILALNSDLPEAHYFLSIIKQHQGDNDGALASLIKALELGLQINNKELILNIAKQMADLKRYDLIEKLYLQAIRLDPKDANLYVYLAADYGKMHNKEKAIEYAKKAAELNSNLKQASENFIQLIENGEWDKIPD